MVAKIFTAAAALAFASTAGAATLTPGGGWSKFFFGGTGSPIVDVTTSDLTYDFTLTSATTLKVTDAYLIGDVFTISDFGAVIGTTSAPGNPLSATTTSPDIAYADPNYSHGAFVLAAGVHSISGVVAVSPYESGGAFLELAGTAVPEPASWALMVAGFGVVGAVARRRREICAA